MKEQVSDDKVVASLKNLRAELLKRQSGCVVSREILFKINSCLFSQYPHQSHVTEALPTGGLHNSNINNETGE